MGTILDEGVDVGFVSPSRDLPGELDLRCPKRLSIRFTGKSNNLRPKLVRMYSPFPGTEAKLFLQAFNNALEQDGQPADIPYPSVPELADSPAPVELSAYRGPAELGERERSDLVSGMRR